MPTPSRLSSQLRLLPVLEDIGAVASRWHLSSVLHIAWKSETQKDNTITVVGTGWESNLGPTSSQVKWESHLRHSLARSNR